MTPSLPQRGKQPKGSIPLTPSFFGVYFNLIRNYRNRGMPKRRGKKHEKLEPPRAIVYFFVRVSTKPFFYKSSIRILIE
jgi:hypothetical protein